MLNESAAREKNRAVIIIIISIKMMRLLRSMVNFPCIHLYLTPSPSPNGRGESAGHKHTI